VVLPGSAEPRPGTLRGVGDEAVVRGRLLPGEMK